MATVADLITAAKAQLGKPYLYGAEGPTRFDCSGLIQYVYGMIGIRTPRTAAEQQSAAETVTNPQPGDLVFYGKPAHHVALYIGNGQMIAAPHSGAVVQVQSVYGTPTYGRLATLSGGSGLGATLAGLGNGATNIGFSLDSFFGQVKGVSLQLAGTTLGLALMGLGLWRLTGAQVRRKADEAATQLTGV